MGKRHWLGVLALAAAVGCGKSDNTPQGEAPSASNAPVQMNISGGDSSTVLNADNIKAEIDKAGVGVKLVKLDLSSAGLPLTLDAPEGATIHSGPGTDARIVAGDRFALQIKLGKSRLERKRQARTGQKVLINDKDLLLCESSLLLNLRREFGQHLVVGHQDFCVENLDPLDGKLVNHSQADCLLMLKCAGTLAPKTPPPADAVTAMQQLKANVVKAADGRVTGLVLDARQTTDATLALLPKIGDALERLNLHGCAIGDDGLTHLRGLSSLRELDLSDCEFTDAGLSALTGLTNLETLNLASSFGDSPQIKGPGLAALAGMTKLRVLVLDKNLVDDTGLVHLKNLKALAELRLEQTRVAGPGLANLKELSGLTLLSLNFAKITDAGLEGLHGLSGLEVLNLQGNTVNGEGLKHLSGLKKLRSLNLGDTPLGDAALDHLHGLKSLKQVVLARTQVTKAGADKLKAALPGAAVTMD